MLQISDQNRVLTFRKKRRKMKTIFSLFFLLISSLGAFSAPALSTEELIDTATIKNISDAYLYATYLSQHASTIVDYLPVNDTNPSVCFIKGRNPNTSVPPMDRLRQDRGWMNPLYNYSSDIYEAQCGNLRGLSQSQQIICIEIVNMIETMDTLKKKLDKIITGEGEVVEVTASPTGHDCWDLSLGQQYWNFNALHALALFIKMDLEALQTILIHS